MLLQARTNQVAPTVPPRSLQEQSFFDPGTGAAAWECECRLSFRRVAAALTTRCAAADIPAACALVRSPIERRRAASASSRSCRAYAKRASDRCRNFAGDCSLPPPCGPAAVTIRRFASSGVKGSVLHGWTSSQPSGGFPNLSTNRSDASASDSYWPATDSIARRAPSLRIASAAFRASSARLRQYSGLRSGMTFSATPRAAARQAGTRV